MLVEIALMIRGIIDDRLSPRLGHPDRHVGTRHHRGRVIIMIHDRIQ
jgi:hypothetical protein